MIGKFVAQSSSIFFCSIRQPCWSFDRMIISFGERDERSTAEDAEYGEDCGKWDDAIVFGLKSLISAGFVDAEVWLAFVPELVLELELEFEFEFEFEWKFAFTLLAFKGVVETWFETIGVMEGIATLQVRLEAEFGFEFDEEEITEAEVAVDEMEAFENIVLRLVGVMDEGESSKERLLSWRSRAEVEVGVALDRSSSIIEGKENLLILKE